MYGPFVRDNLPPREHLPSILDIEPGHAQRHGHPLLWLMTAIIIGSAMASWYFGVLPH